MKIKIFFNFTINLLSIASIFAQDINVLNRIDLLLIKEEYVSAINGLNHLIEKDSSNSNSYYKLGLAYQGNYQNGKAITILRKAIQIDSSNEILSALAKSYYNLGLFDMAEKYYYQAFNKDSMNKNIAFSLAKVYLEKQNFKNAKRIYFNLIRNDTTDDYLYKQMGYCAMKTDSLNSSLKYYQKALELNWEDPNIPVQMATICFKQGKLDSALQYVNTGLEIIQDEPNFNKLKADILFKKGKYNEAKELYLKVIEGGDSSASVYQRLGFCFYFYAAGEDSTVKQDSSLFDRYEIYNKALNAFKKAFKLESNNPITCYYAGLTRDKIGYHDLEIFYFNETIKLTIPEYLPKIYNYLGRAYQLREKYSESIESFKKALFYDPEHIDLLFYIGVIYEDYLKDNIEALNYYQLFLSEKENKTLGLKSLAESKIKSLRSNKASNKVDKK